MSSNLLRLVVVINQVAVDIVVVEDQEKEKSPTTITTTTPTTPTTATTTATTATTTMPAIVIVTMREVMVTNGVKHDLFV